MSNLEETNLEERSCAARPNIFQYRDYRKFLSDFVEYKQIQNPRYSLSMLARRSGMTGIDLMRLIILGKRSLTERFIHQVAKACSLGSREKEYFCTLVSWNQATVQEEKDRLWQELLKRTPLPPARKLKKQEAEMFTRWYVSAILEMVRLEGFQPSGRWISQKLNQMISVQEAEEGLKFLMSVGLLTWRNDMVVLTHMNIEFGSDFPNVCIQNYHQKVASLGIEMIKKVNPKAREYAAGTIAVRKEDLAVLKEEVRKFQERLMEITTHAEKPQGVYQVNIQCFPLVAFPNESNGE